MIILKSPKFDKLTRIINVIVQVHANDIQKNPVVAVKGSICQTKVKRIIITHLSGFFVI